MENIIPLNGRIAIVDDDVNQALPSISVLSRHNIPYVFYKGNDVKYLPDSPENDGSHAGEGKTHVRTGKTGAVLPAGS